MTHLPIGGAIVRAEVLTRSRTGDDYIVNCAICGAFTSDLPWCELCEASGLISQEQMDGYLLAMPNDWPSRKMHETHITEARRRRQAPEVPHE